MEKHCLIRKFALCSVSMLAFSLSSAAYANPEGGQVVGGSATIESSGKKLDVHQHTDRAVIDWRSFDIQVDEHTQFHQPSSSATALNRVNSPDPSRIAGKLSANGSVILINPNGVFFEGTSQVDVNGLIATTADIDNQDFMAGKLHFNKPGNPNAAVVNVGTITAKEAGLVALVAPNVANHGVINAKLGRVELASGDSVMADLYGDGLYELKVSDEVASQLVSNTGSINAEGGTIAITAAAGKEIVHSLVTIEGELKAPTIEKKGGKIIIAAEGSNAVAGNKTEDKGKKQGNSTVLIANAHINASGRNEGEQGGEIEITADNIGILQNTLIDASGHSAPVTTSKPDVPSKGTATLTADKQVRKEEEFLAHENRAGGSIKIGGDYLGSGDTAAANYVYIDANSVIFNDATHSGDAGRTIIWSDDTTHYYGNVFARGGTEGGNGGFLETSGKKYLDAQGYADLTATDGYKKGTYLLDPANITIYGNVASVFNSGNLIGHWDFEEGAGVNAADSSGNGNDGTLTNGPTWVTTTAPTPQKNDYSISLNGSNDVTVANIAQLGGKTQASFSYWVRYTATGGWDLAGTAACCAIRLGRQPSGNTFINPGTHTDITGAGNVLASNDTWYHLVLTMDAGNEWKLYVDGTEVSSGNNGLPASFSAVSWSFGASARHNIQGIIDDPRIYDSVLSSNDVAELYGTRFTADGLEYMSQTADIVLQADNTITLDLQGDALMLDNERSITLQTTNGNISTASAGSIITNRTGAGGNITFNAGGTGNINIDHALTLTAQNGGEISFTAGGGNVNITDNFNLTTDNFNLTTDNFNLTGTLNGTGAGTFTYQQGTAGNSLGVGTGGAPDITLSDALIADVKTAFSNYSFGRLDGGAVTNYTAAWEDPVTFLSGGNFTNAVSTTSDDTILVRAGGDVILDADMATTSATANALVLSAGDDFLNNAGSDALSATNSRWLVYSDEPANNTRDGLLPSASDFNKTYAANAPATIGAGNRFVYATATQPTVIYQVGDDTVEYGDAYSGTPSLTYSSGLVGDDTLLNIGLTGSANAATSYNPGDNVGTYNNAMTATAGTLSSPLGYQYAFVAGDLDVTQAALTVNLDNKSREYGDANPALTATINGFKLTDDESDLDTAPTYSTAATQNSNVGNYAITGAGGSDTNYSFNYVDGSLSITKAPLLVSLLDSSPERQVGQANPAFGLTYTGFKLSDTQSVLDSTPTASTLADSNSTEGSYDITIAGGSDNNYDLQYTNPAGSLTVTAEPVTPPEPPTTNENADLPNTVVMTSQNPTVATTGTVSATNSTGGEDSMETSSNSTSRSLKSKAQKALYGLVEIHPSLVRLFNLDKDRSIF